MAWQAVRFCGPHDGPTGLRLTSDTVGSALGTAQSQLLPDAAQGPLQQHDCKQLLGSLLLLLLLLLSVRYQLARLCTL